LGKIFWFPVKYFLIILLHVCSFVLSAIIVFMDKVEELRFGKRIPPENFYPGSKY
jgi:hypothetical protein